MRQHHHVAALQWPLPRLLLHLCLIRMRQSVFVFIWSKFGPEEVNLELVVEQLVKMDSAIQSLSASIQHLLLSSTSGSDSNDGPNTASNAVVIAETVLVIV